MNRVIVYHLRNWAICLTLCIGPCLSLPAQTINLQVISKEVSKDMKYAEGQILSVQGEKSEVNITTWGNDYIHIELKLTAQHPERAIAEEDLENFIYTFENNVDTIYITNQILEKEETLRSGLQAYYTIQIPLSCNVKLENYFGTAELTDLHQGVDINSEFCNLKLKNVLGTVNVDTYFGDLIEIAGSFNIDAYKGVVKVFANKSLLEDINITGEKTDVFFYDTELKGYSFDLISRNGSVELPDDLEANYSKQDEIRMINIQPQAELIGVKVAINVISGDIMLESR